MNLGRRVLAENVDRPALLFRLTERVRPAPVEALGGQDKLGVFEIVDQSDRRVDGLYGLLELALVDAVWENGDPAVL